MVEVGVEVRGAVGVEVGVQVGVQVRGGTGTDVLVGVAVVVPVGAFMGDLQVAVCPRCRPREPGP